MRGASWKRKTRGGGLAHLVAGPRLSPPLVARNPDIQEIDRLRGAIGERIADPAGKLDDAVALAGL